jgi:hypothetical protein
MSARLGRGAAATGTEADIRPRPATPFADNAAAAPIANRAQMPLPALAFALAGIVAQPIRVNLDTVRKDQE